MLQIQLIEITQTLSSDVAYYAILLLWDSQARVNINHHASIYPSRRLYIFQFPLFPSSTFLLVLRIESFSFSTTKF